MEIKPFSKKQYEVLTWWCNKSRNKNKNAVICDGAVRSGKTFCMSISFVFWSFYRFRDQCFAICGKTIRSARRNIITPMISTLSNLGFTVEEKLSENRLQISYRGVTNRYYIFGGKDESSASLIQGMTLAGVLFDEVALMPRSFVEQALARCSVENSKYWFNCNPEYPSHWFYRSWIKQSKKKNALYIHFTMQDNPSLSKSTIRRYENLYSGSFYQRFILGKWVAVTGAVYPFMNDSSFESVPNPPFERYVVSVDYGTVNPASMGLWALKDEVWYRIEESYFDSRREGFQKTDEEHYTALEGLIGTKSVETIVVDPSAASFIETIRRHGEYSVTPAKNNVINGIRRTAAALKQREIVICNNCADSIREFSLYRWDEKGQDNPMKENDHAMDDIRYFVSTVLDGESGFAVLAARR